MGQASSLCHRPSSSLRTQLLSRGIPFNGHDFLWYGIWTHIPVSVLTGGVGSVGRNRERPFTCLIGPPLTKCLLIVSRHSLSFTFLPTVLFFILFLFCHVQELFLINIFVIPFSTFNLCGNSPSLSSKPSRQIRFLWLNLHRATGSPGDRIREKNRIFYLGLTHTGWHPRNSRKSE